jgi:hypothetical protein
MRIPKIHIRCFPPISETGRHLGFSLPGDLTAGRQLNHNRNPFGHRGKAAYGYKAKPVKKPIPRTEEEIQIVRDAREIKELAAKHAPSAIKVIADIMNNPKTLDAVRLAAANALVDRGYGKSTQTSVTATVNADGKPSEVDDKTLDERIKSALTRIERVAGRETKPPPREKRSINVRKLH